MEWATNTEVQTAHELDEWWRFRDDVFLLGRNMQKMRCSLDGFRNRIGSVYTMEVEAASKSQVDFLAVEVTLAGNKLTTRPREKPRGGSFD